MADVARDEVLAEFEENCALPRQADADGFLEDLYRLNVEPLLESRRILWAGKERKYVLACMAGLGRVAFLRADAAGVVSAQHLIESVAELLPCWERACPLPRARGDKSVSALLSGCETTRSLLPAGLLPA